MKHHATLLPALLCLATNGFAQLQFVEHTISRSADAAHSVYAADIDGDGDLDVLSASWGDDKIAWYENDGLPAPTFTAHVITTNAADAWSVYAADLDGDGDVDVLSASIFDKKIAWYENDGNQNFGEHTITNSANGARSVYAADVDGDGDLDVLSASFLDNKIAWYENNGNQNFLTRVITFNAEGASSVYAADVDGDGDRDVLSASVNDDKIAWYENDGMPVPTFPPHVITTNANASLSVYAVDLDVDGDVDVLSASWQDNKIAWYENDGNQNFTEHALTTKALQAQSVYAADLDSDGDQDVLSASFGDDKIVWYENDGNRNFAAHTITTNAANATSVYAADVDGDGDLDVLSASSFDDKIAWYENQRIATAVTESRTSAAPHEFSLRQNYPNPFNPSTMISYQLPQVAQVRLAIYNLLGERVRTLVDAKESAGVKQVTWDGRNDRGERVSSGVYVYRLEAGTFVETRKAIFLK